MGLQHREFPIHGVQFHPESILTGEGKKLLANFLKLSSANVLRHPERSEGPHSWCDHTYRVTRDK